jgi:hypothetical protein
VQTAVHAASFDNLLFCEARVHEVKLNADIIKRTFCVLRAAYHARPHVNVGSVGTQGEISSTTPGVQQAAPDRPSELVELVQTTMKQKKLRRCQREMACRKHSLKQNQRPQNRVLLVGL